MVNARATVLQRIAQGDQSAVAACLDEYGNTVWLIARRYLSGMGEDMEDAVKDVFVEVWRSAYRFNPSIASEAAFIATIAHRRMISRQRRASRRRTIALGSIAEPALVKIKDLPLLHDEARAAAAAFQKLEDDEKHLLWLSIQSGLTHERIAQATSLPLGTVKTRIRRGLIHIRAMLAARSAEHAPQGVLLVVEPAT